MDYKKLESVINSSEKTKSKILEECGVSLPGFNGMIKGSSVKVAFLEKFCEVTQTHISEFFEEWYVTDEKKNIPGHESNLGDIKKTLQGDLKVLLQSKDDLIAEQRARISELTEVLDLYKSGRIKPQG